MKKVLLFFLLLLPVVAQACFQVGQQPSAVRNKDIKVRFAYDGKAIANAPVSLWTRKKGTIARSTTDSNGWSVFRDLPSGEYRVALESPSYETNEVVLTRIDTAKTAMLVNFTGDYCRSVAVVPDRSVNQP